MEQEEHFLEPERQGEISEIVDFIQLVEESHILLIHEKEDFPLLDEENVQLESNKSEGIHVVNSTYKKML